METLHDQQLKVVEQRVKDVTGCEKLPFSIFCHLSPELNQGIPPLTLSLQSDGERHPESTTKKQWLQLLVTPANHCIANVIKQFVLITAHTDKRFIQAACIAYSSERYIDISSFYNFCLQIY